MDLNDKRSVLQGEGTAMWQRSQGRKVLPETEDGEVVAKEGGGGPAPEPEQGSWASTLSAVEAAGVSGGVLPECSRRTDWRYRRMPHPAVSKPAWPWFEQFHMVSESICLGRLAAWGQDS